MAKPPIKKVVGVNILLFALLLGGLEAGLARVYNHTQSPGPLAAARYYYSHEQATIIQYNLETAQYDPHTTYIFRPGAHRFRNHEFDTTVTINSAGVRDDEASLQAPSIIVLGDSHAMGWGVEDHESFPTLLENQLGTRVLNTGVSSYGTVRELILLERLDRSKLEWLIIQYCTNDFMENRHFMKGGSKFGIMNEQQYLATARNHMESRASRPHFEYTRSFLPMLKHTDDFLPPRDSENVATREVVAFLNALQKSRTDLSGLRIVVMPIDNNGANNPLFLDALYQGLNQPGVLDGWAKELEFTLVNLHDTLTLEDDYFRLDDHMTPSGHVKVANRLNKVLTQARRRRPGTVRFWSEADQSNTL